MAEQLAVLEANRARRQAIEAFDRCDFEAAASTLQSSRSLLAAMPSSDLLRKEIDLLNEKQGLLERDRNRFRKSLRMESLRSSTEVWEGDDDAS